VLAEKAWVVNGELIESDVEKFVRKRLGLKEDKDSKEKNETKKDQSKTEYPKP
jgi:hypothetical protein